MKRLLCMLTLAAALFGASLVDAEDPAHQQAKDPKAKSAVSVNDPKAFQGYTLVSPMTSTKSYLIDMEGKVVRTWEGAGTPAITAYLLPNGNLFRPCSGEAGALRPNGGIFPKGRIQEFTWDGELVWDFAFQSNKDIGKGTYTHDMIKLPNGNVLAVMTVEKTAAETAAAGRKAAALDVGVSRRTQAQGQKRRAGRLGMARLGPLDPGQRCRQGELRQSGRPPRAH